VPRIVALGAIVALAPALAGAGLGSGRSSATHDEPVVTHGVVVGDIGPGSAVLWARSSRAATLHVTVQGGPHDRPRTVRTGPDGDFTAQVRLEDLAPARVYRYRVRFDRGPVVSGSFRTAPDAGKRVAVKLAFGGDVAGQNVCRDAGEGFPIADTIRSFAPDVFVGLGDMVYADNACDPVGRYGNTQVPGDFGPATDLAGFRAHWRYNRADPALERLLASASYVGVWDDHEVVNDFGPLHDTRDTPPYTPGVHLLPLGLRAFLDYTPVSSATEASPGRLYRALRYGRNLELFVLDTRQYRDANSALDTAAAPKTMLGREQLAWLDARLAASNATWKVVVSSVPMSIPTGFPAENGRDGWANFDQATGFERELLGILRGAADRGDRMVWITTDVHFAEVLRYRPFADRPGFVVHELVTGPLNSGIFPVRDVDPTLAPEVLTFYGPATATDVTTWAEAKRWFNFGTLELAADGSLTAGIVNTAGERVFDLDLGP
jgi:alkaline phosphatase D